MYTQTAMAKDLTFKLRLDAKDRERLEAVAAHLSVPAATAIRIAIKEKYDALPPPTFPVFVPLADGKYAMAKDGELGKDEKGQITLSFPDGQAFRLGKGPHFEWVPVKPRKSARKGSK